MNIGIVGLGTVGNAMRRLFPAASIYDEPLGVGSRDDINACDIAFICVPTPGTTGGWLDTTIVENVVAWTRADLIVVRSTLNPGTTDALKKAWKKRIIYQPEYIGESASHPLANPLHHPFIILGGDRSDTRCAIELYQEVYNSSIRIRQTDALTAEIIKLAENRAIAHKLAEVFELFDLCEAAGVDYYTVREAVYQDDPRMSPYWTFVDPKRRGFYSKCIPKDVHAIAAYARNAGMPLHVTESVLHRNEQYRTGTEGDPRAAADDNSAPQEAKAREARGTANGTS